MFDDTVERNPSDLDILTRMALAAQNSAYYVYASRRWYTLCQKHPQKVLFHIQYILSLLQNLETKRAWIHFHNQKENFKKLDFQILKVRILKADGKYEEALAYLKILSSIFKNSAEVNINIGQILIDLERFDDAETWIEDLINLNPERAVFDAMLASLASSQAKYSLAKGRWFNLLQEDPKNEIYNNGYMSSLLSLRQFREAEKNLREKSSYYEGDEVYALSLEVQVKIAQKSHDVLNVIQEFRKQYDPLQFKFWKQLRFNSILLELYQFMYDITGDRRYLFMRLDVAQKELELRPGWVYKKIALCRSLIALNMREEAIGIINALPQSLNPNILTLRSWKANQTGDIETAKDIWKKQKSIHFIPQIKAINPDILHRKDENSILCKQNEIRLITAIRNEKWRLPWFLDYYRNLGVDRFFFIDNASTDGSGDFLRAQSDVHLFWTNQTYFESKSALRWINHLVREYPTDGWVIYVDVDEALVFPNIENSNLRLLTDYMEYKHEEVLPAFMLDMFGDKAQNSDENTTFDFFNDYKLFNNNYTFTPVENCPYFKANGGAMRQIHPAQMLAKTPLIRDQRGIEFLQSSHRISPSKVSKISGTLLHFKLAGDFRSAFKEESKNIDRGGCQKRFADFNNYFEKNALETLTDKTTMLYQSSQQLIDLGLIKCPDEFWNYPE